MGFEMTEEQKPRGGVMQPSIISGLPKAWAENPAAEKLKWFYGGEKPPWLGLADVGRKPPEV